MAVAVETKGEVRRRRKVSWRRVASWIVGVVAVLAIAGYLGVGAYAANSLSQPSRRDVGNCADYGLTCQDVQFAGAQDNIPLSGWFIDSPGTKTVMILHGINGARDDKGIGIGKIAASLNRNNYDVFMFDFRGHGNSGGERTSVGDWERRDVEGALNYLKTMGVNEVGVLAFSMGAATALNTAVDHPEMKALALDSSFADLPRELGYQLPKKGLPAFFVPATAFMGQLVFGMNIWGNSPEKQLAKLGNRPVLVMHSTVDSTTPTSHAYDLQKAAQEGKLTNFQFWVADGTGHVQLYNTFPEEYMNRVLDLFDKNL